MLVKQGFTHSDQRAMQGGVVEVSGISERRVVGWWQREHTDQEGRKTLAVGGESMPWPIFIDVVRKIGGKVCITEMNVFADGDYGDDVDLLAPFVVNVPLTKYDPNNPDHKKLRPGQP